MPDLKITLIQSDIFWEDRDSNLEMFSRKLDLIDGETDLVVLPEMFTTGFSMNTSELSEGMEGPSVDWMRKEANSRDLVLTGSLIIRDGEGVYNRLFWVRPEGTFDTYDKKHLFRMADEHRFYTPGGTRLTVELKGWRICPLVCYDLRFPVWSRNRDDYDCLLYVANWPEARRSVWKTLLRARAMENQAYVIGVNRIGRDGLERNYSGDSCVIDPRGEISSRTEPHTESVETVLLSWNDLEEYREEFQVSKDADAFRILD